MLPSKLIPLTLLFCATMSSAQPFDVIWERNGDWNEAHFGALIYPLGDQNDDGFDDWVVLSGGQVEPPMPGDARLDFFHGGNSPSLIPYLTIVPHQNPTAYMNVLRNMGDINGDGYIDMGIGFYVSQADSITIEIYGGGPNADTIPETTFRMPYQPAWDSFGSIGDHNGDGHADFYYFKRNIDMTYLFWGSADWDVVWDLINQGEPIGSGNSHPSGGTFGDFNGDSFDDYLTGTPPPNELTYVYFGSSDPDTVPDIEWNGSFDSPATLSVDMNNDGAAELVIARTQSIDVHFGGSNPSSIPTVVLHYSGCANASVNYIYSAGDYNGDGYEDLVAVSDNCASGFGKLFLFLGSSWVNFDPVLEIEGLSGAPFDDVPIWRAIGLGDVNGDGIDDLAIGCQGTVLEGSRGRVVILSGDTTLIVPVENEEPELPQQISLYCFPNPFNSSTTFSYSLSHDSDIKLSLFDLLGRESAIIFDGQQTSGTHTITFTASDLPSGIYFAQLKSASQAQTQKIILLK